MAGKLAWVMKVVSASSGRPRSSARQGKPPSVAPERQARREGTDVASAAGGARGAAGARGAGSPALGPMAGGGAGLGAGAGGGGPPPPGPPGGGGAGGEGAGC